MTDTHLQFPSADWSQALLCGVQMWRSAVLSQQPHLVHVFTPDGYNMSASSGPDFAATAQRRQRLGRAIGAGDGSFAVGRQVHGTNIARVTRSAGSEPQLLDAVDGLVTDEPMTPLLAMTADCPVVLVYARARRALGIAHSGWRGTCARMPSLLIDAMRREFQVAAGDLVVTVAPCAGVCCYEVKEDVCDQVGLVSQNAGMHIDSRSGKTFLNLPSLIAEQLTDRGVPIGQVHLPVQCSICDDRFYSYRRQGPNAGQAALVAMLL